MGLKMKSNVHPLGNIMISQGKKGFFCRSLPQNVSPQAACSKSTCSPDNLISIQSQECDFYLKKRTKAIKIKFIVS